MKGIYIKILQKLQVVTKALLLILSAALFCITFSAHAANVVNSTGNVSSTFSSTGYTGTYNNDYFYFYGTSTISISSQTVYFNFGSVHTTAGYSTELCVIPFAYIEPDGNISTNLATAISAGTCYTGIGTGTFAATGNYNISTGTISNFSISPQEGLYMVNYGANGSFTSAATVVSSTPFGTASYGGGGGPILNAWGYLGTSPEPSPPGTSIGFIFPTNGELTAPFPAYLFQVNNPIVGDRYVWTINDFVPQVTGQFTATGYCIGHPSNSVAGDGCEVGNISVNHLENLDFGEATSVDGVAELSVVDQTADPNTIISSTTVVFNMIPLKVGGINKNGTSTINVQNIVRNNYGASTGAATTTSSYPAGSQTTNLSTSTLGCANPTDWGNIGEDIAYGLCGAGWVLFNPSVTGSYLTDSLKNTYADFQTTFPFNLVFGLNTIIANATTQFASSTGDPKISFTMPAFVPSIGGQTINFITSSTLLNAVGATNFAWLMQIEDAAMWLFIAFLMYEIATKRK